MLRRDKSIFSIILSGMLVLLCIVVVPTAGYLMFINLPERINRNECEILQKQTYNRKTYLEQMFLENDDLSELSNKIDETMTELIDTGTITLTDQNLSNRDYVTVLQKISADMISTLRSKDVTGIFVVLNAQNMDELEADAELPGIYIRDLDPDATPSFRNTDLLLERSPTELVQSLIFPLIKIGVLLLLLILLILPDGTLYGVLGVEMLESYLCSVMLSSELEHNETGKYYLVHTERAKSEGKIPLYAAATSAHETSENEEILWVDLDKNEDCWITIQEERYYASVQPLEIYNRNTLFSDETWFLVGCVQHQNYLHFQMRFDCIFGLHV